MQNNEDFLYFVGLSSGVNLHYTASFLKSNLIIYKIFFLLFSSNLLTVDATFLSVRFTFFIRSINN